MHCRRFPVAPLLFAAALTLTACAGSTDDLSNQPGSDNIPGCGEPTAEMAADGMAIYAGKGLCFSCHGDAGVGLPMVAPDLTDGAWLNTDGSYQGIVSVVRNGVLSPVEHPAPMPPMGGVQLTDEEICAVAAYVHSLAGR